LQLWLTVVPLETPLDSTLADVIERLELGAANRRFVATADPKTLQLLLLHPFRLVLVPIEILHLLLGALIRVSLHTFVTATGPIDDSRSGRVTMVSQTIFIGWWQLSIAVRVLGLILVEKPLVFLCH